MPSVRLRGISARITDDTVFEKAKKIRETMGNAYRIIIDRDRITVEGDVLDPDIRKRISEILNN